MTVGEVVCPECHSSLAPRVDGLGCKNCARTYRLADGVPILIPDALTSQQCSQVEYFDAKFSDYGAYRVDDWRRSYLNRISEALDLESVESYLDVGVGGSGVSVIEVARRGIRAAGVDVSSEGVRSAAAFADSEGVADRTTFVVCAAERLPFRDETFGACSAVAILEHVDDDLVVLSELARVTRPGGRIWITVPIAYRWMPPFVWPWYWWHDRRIGHKRHYDEPQILEIAASVGLEHVATSYSGHPTKVAQLALDKVARYLGEPRRTALWWRLERLDHRALNRRLWAVQLHIVLRRPTV